MTLAASYRRLAPIYDWIVRAPLERARRRSLAQVPATGRLEILLSGIGTGLDLPHLPTCHRYFATDLVEAMLARARRRSGELDIRWARADSMRLPFHTASFDLVVLHLIVAVVAQPATVLAEAERVTRSGGTVLVLDKFLRAGGRAGLRRYLSPLAARVATRLDVVFEDLLMQVPQLTLVQDEPVLAGGWFRSIVLRKHAGESGGALAGIPQRGSSESRS